MNISDVHSALPQMPARRQAGDAGQGDLPSRYAVGDQVTLDVVRRIDGGKYLVSFGGQPRGTDSPVPPDAGKYFVSFGSEQHVMESTISLDVGSRVRAVVVRSGDRLELRYVDAAGGAMLSGRQASGDEAATASEEAAPAQRSLLAALENRYHVTLDADEHTRLERAANRAESPDAMALGGLYLAKLGVPIEDASLHALHAAQTSSAVASLAHSQWRSVSPLLEETASGNEKSTQELAQVLGSALPESPTQASFGGSSDMSNGDGQSDAQKRGDLARLLLNLQDGGSVGYQYGTLPVLVGGQLVELSLVVLQQRQEQNATAPVRRLVMNVPTESFGSVRIDARALENRLVVTFSGGSPANTEGFEACRGELQQLLKRLGWNVEGIDYRFGGAPDNGARDIIAHVLSSGTVDMVF